MLNQSKLMLHGVFMKIFTLGVILSGDSGVGKSELALSLLDRGHQLIADDVIELYQNDGQELWAGPPPALEKLLEIRGLGIFNIAELLGPAAIAPPRAVNLIIHLSKTHDLIRRTEPLITHSSYLEHKVAQIELEYIESRPLAILIETIVRQWQLSLQGKTATTLPAMPERIPL